MSHSWPPEAAVRYLNTWLPVVAFLLELSPTVFRASPPVSTVLIILYTSPHEALLLPVVVSSIVETTCAVHLESIHTWVARLNLVNDQGLGYRLKGIYDLKSISGYQHTNIGSILHLLNLWQLANREYWYSRKINCQYFLQTCLHWPPSNYFLFFMESK